MNVAERSKAIASHPEVIEAMKVLEKHGAGVMLLHAHGDDGEFIELPPGIVSFEEDLKIRFRKPLAEDNGKYVTVGWAWDGKTNRPIEVAKCTTHQWCEER